MPLTSSTVIAVDTSVLINFLCVDRMDLIARHCHQFIVTDHVAAEVKDFYSDQQTRLKTALQSSALKQVSIADQREVALFGSLGESRRLGPGECSAIALAVSREYILAIDDRQATNQAREISRDLCILTTQDLIVAMICENLLSVAEADQLKETWAHQHRFRLPIKSFSDVLTTNCEK